LSQRISRNPAKAVDVGDAGNSASPYEFINMQTKYEAIMAKAVGVKLTKATELGIKASWTTANHLDALADVIDAFPEETREILGECYNVSAFQQMLAKKFEKLGHFQRSATKPTSEQADDLFAKLAADVAKGG